MGIALFVAHPTGTCERSLRRFTFLSDIACPATRWGHNASVIIGEIPEAEKQSHGDPRLLETEIDHSDPRWPRTCSACDYEFIDADQWQLNDYELYRAGDGRTFTQRTSPTGAMLRMPWADEAFGGPAPGSSLTEAWHIRLPDGGEWITTQHATSGGFWAVDGAPPHITVAPSIFHNPTGNPPGWHGFIRDGAMDPA